MTEEPIDYGYEPVCPMSEVDHATAHYPAVTYNGSVRLWEYERIAPLGFILFVHRRPGD